MSLTKFFTIIVLSVLLTYAGLKGYMYFKIKNAWNTLAEQSAPFVQLQRGGITSSLSGSAGVTDVSITFVESGETVRVDRIEFLTSSMLDLMKLASASNSMESAPFLFAKKNSAKLPKFIGFNIAGIHLDLDSEYLKTLDKSARENEKSTGFALAGCGDISYIGMKEYREMGYSLMKFDIKTLIHLNPDKPTFTLKIDTGIPQMFRISSDAELNIANADDPNLARATPRMVNMSLAYQDDSFQQRVNKLCLSHGASDQQSVNHGQMAYFQHQMRTLGIELDQPTLAAYQKFLGKPGTLTIKSSPSSPVDFATIKFYKPSDVPALLGLSVSATH